IVKREARAAVILESPAKPMQCARLTTIGAMGEVGAALRIVGHPGIGHQTLEHAALHIKAVSSDLVYGDVVDVPVVGPAIVAIGDDLEAVPLRAVALDGEVAESQIAQVDAGSDIDLDDRRPVSDL